MSEAELEDEASDLDLYPVRDSRRRTSTYPRPRPETGFTGRSVELPEVPVFPPTSSNGVLDVAALRRLHTSLVGRDIALRGTIMWRRDCLDQHARPSVPPAELKRYLRANPDKCSPSELFLGQNRDTAFEDAVWIVGAPAFLDLKVGDQVIVHGRWGVMSPDGKLHRSGLLTFARWQQSLAP